MRQQQPEGPRRTRIVLLRHTRVVRANSTFKGVPIEHTIPSEARYTLLPCGRGQMIDHMLVTRNLLAHYRGSEIHNEILHDDSIAFAIDIKYPESDHALVVATFDFA